MIMKNNEVSSQQVYDTLINTVGTIYGSPRGRENVGSRKSVKRKQIFRRRVFLIYNKAYDKGGAYWGMGDPLYVEFTLDKSYVRFFRIKAES